ncbi:hypothetical protein HBB16_01240 [Pseudonocardia sp. MCCB 268]|nr:hypothetical protein [Pseudonocardia cytotoxica]
MAAPQTRRNPPGGTQAGGRRRGPGRQRHHGDNPCRRPVETCRCPPGGPWCAPAARVDDAVFAFVRRATPAFDTLDVDDPRVLVALAESARHVPDG